MLLSTLPAISIQYVILQSASEYGCMGMTFSVLL